MDHSKNGNYPPRLMSDDDGGETAENRLGIPAAAVLTTRDPRTYAPPCDHNDGYLRLHVLTNGAKHYKFQCLTCGRNGSAVRGDHWLFAQMSIDPPLIDNELKERWWKKLDTERRSAMDAERAAKDAAWWDWYNRYLQSPGWALRRQKVLMRDRGICRADLDGCQRTVRPRPDFSQLTHFST